MHSISLNSNCFGAASKSAHQTLDDLGSSTGTILLVICSISSRLYFQSQMKRVCGYKSFAKIMHRNPWVLAAEANPFSCGFHLFH